MGLQYLPMVVIQSETFQNYGGLAAWHETIWKLNTSNNAEYKSSDNLKWTIEVNLKWKKKVSFEYEKSKENKLLSEKR